MNIVKIEILDNVSHSKGLGRHKKSMNTTPTLQDIDDPFWTFGAAYGVLLRLKRTFHMETQVTVWTECCRTLMRKSSQDQKNRLAKGIIQGLAP